MSTSLERSLEVYSDTRPFRFNEGDFYRALTLLMTEGPYLSGDGKVLHSDRSRVFGIVGIDTTITSREDFARFWRAVHRHPEDEIEYWNLSKDAPEFYWPKPADLIVVDGVLDRLKGGAIRRQLVPQLVELLCQDGVLLANADLVSPRQEEFGVTRSLDTTRSLLSDLRLVGYTMTREWDAVLALTRHMHPVKPSGNIPYLLTTRQESRKSLDALYAHANAAANSN